MAAQPTVSDTPSPGAVRLAASGRAAPILTDAADHPGVLRAADDLQADVERVASVRPERTEAARGAADVVIVGTLGRSRIVDRLVAAGRLDVSAVRGRWEASVVAVVAHPLPGVERALVVAGSDPRGTIYGVYDVSERIGVSPWYFWADVPPVERAAVFVTPGRWIRREPAVRYRGIFINDEAPALSGWAKERFGGFNARFYAHVFELLLRLRGNFLWPAMWGSAFADDDPASPALADRYGIVMGTSHHEPMTRAHDEWRRYGQGGAWDYRTNADALRAFWTEGIRRVGAYENVVTLGMRGDGDEPMEREANVALLERIVADQRSILSRELGARTVPQVWALYKEVQEYYEKGMRVPDDVTLLWCDDNWGNIRRLPTAEERKRPGGAGVYYHFDYVGGPRSYKWIDTVPVPKVWEQMHLAWRHGATRLWIVNVGDIKPMELPTTFFLDYAWDPEKWPAERLPDYTREWAARAFGPENAAAIASMLDRYTRFNGRRKPEMLDPATYSLLHYAESERVVKEYEDLAREAEALARRLPPEHQAAFFELVLFPIQASANLNGLYRAVGLNRMHAAQGRASTRLHGEEARSRLRKDAALTERYHALLDGKWAHMMDQTHIGYTSWNQPLANVMPAVHDLQAAKVSEMGVAVEGSDASWPGGPGEPTLPALDPYDPAPRTFEVFNRGTKRFPFEAVPSEPWLEVGVRKGFVDRDRTVRVSARWPEVPPGTKEGTVTVRHVGGPSVTIRVPLVAPGPRREDLAGFVETNGVVSIEAEHYERALAPRGREWKTIPGHGRTLSGVTPWPVTDAAPPDGSMRLEYAAHLFHEGPVEVAVHLAPTQPFRPGPGFRFAVAFDDQPPQVVNVHADVSRAAWERSVAEGVTIATSKHTLAPGPHVLKIVAIDPGLVFQKVVIDAGGLKPSYLGPPESPRGDRRPNGDERARITSGSNVRSIRRSRPGSRGSRSPGR